MNGSRPKRRPCLVPAFRVFISTSQILHAEKMQFISFHPPKPNAPFQTPSLSCFPPTNPISKIPFSRKKKTKSITCKMMRQRDKRMTTTEKYVHKIETSFQTTQSTPIKIRIRSPHAEKAKKSKKSKSKIKNKAVYIKPRSHLPFFRGAKMKKTPVFLAMSHQSNEYKPWTSDNLPPPSFGQEVRGNWRCWKCTILKEHPIEQKI